jgi:hypothetical protein
LPKEGFQVDVPLSPKDYIDTQQQIGRFENDANRLVPELEKERERLRDKCVGAVKSLHERVDPSGTNDKSLAALLAIREFG